jgi:hypothetical protein
MSGEEAAAAAAVAAGGGVLAQYLRNQAEHLRLLTEAHDDTYRHLWALIRLLSENGAIDTSRLTAIEREMAAQEEVDDALDPDSGEEGRS